MNQSSQAIGEGVHQAQAGVHAIEKVNAYLKKLHTAHRDVDACRNMGMYG